MKIKISTKGVRRRTSTHLEKSRSRRCEFCPVLLGEVLGRIKSNKSGVKVFINHQLKLKQSQINEKLVTLQGTCMRMREKNCLQKKRQKWF